MTPRQMLETFRINRNILECKEDIRHSFYKLVCVLIETYWNVKVLSAGGSGVL